MESVPTLLGIDSDTLSVLPYFSGPKFIKEDDHAGGEVKGRVAAGDCSPAAPTDPYVRDYRIRFLK